MIPIQDQNPTRIRPWVNWTLILINITVFLYTLINGTFNDPNATCADNPANALCIYGLKPANIVAGTEYVTFLTSMFLHGGFLHIGGNMLYLWIFGDNVEDLTGHMGYILFYLSTGVAASLAHIASNPASTVPAIGASGAISGVLGAYALRFPRARIRTVVFFRFWVQFVRVPAFIMIGFWFVYQLLLALVDTAGGVAYFAHIGGFIAGLLIALAIPKKKPSEPSFPTAYQAR